MKALSLFLSLFIISVGGLACTCIKMPIDSSFVYAPLIFEGRVVSQYKDAFFYDEAMYSLITNLEIIRDYRGAKDRKMVTIIGGMGCDFFFKEGETYIVFADRRESGIYTASMCSDTQLKSRFDSKDLKRIEKLSEVYNDKFNSAYYMWVSGKERKFNSSKSERMLRLAYFAAKKRADIYKYALIASGIWSVVCTGFLFFRKK